MTHRRLTIEEYRHITEMWGEPLDEDGRVWDPKFCEVGTCWACDEVSRKMYDGTFKDADTEDGVPIWLLPDEYLPEDAEEALAEWMKGRS